MDLSHGSRIVPFQKILLRLFGQHLVHLEGGEDHQHLVHLEGGKDHQHLVHLGEKDYADPDRNDHDQHNYHCLYADLIEGLSPS